MRRTTGDDREPGSAPRTGERPYAAPGTLKDNPSVAKTRAV